MRKILLLLLLCPAALAQTVVQCANNLTTSSASVTATFSSATAAGNAVVLFSREGQDNTSTMTVADSASQSGWTQSNSGYSSANSGNRAALFYRTNSSSITTVTANWSTAVSGTSVAIAACEISGVAAASAEDASVNSSNNSNVTSLTSGSLTTASANDILIYAVQTGGDVTNFTAGSGYAIPNHATDARIAVQTKTVTATQSGTTASMSWTPSQDASSVFIALEAAAAITHVKVVAQATSSTSGVASMTFTLQATNANDAILFGVGCNATGGTPTAVSLSASGWTFTQLSPITGGSGAFMASFGAIAPNASSVTATVSWTAPGNTCSGFQNVLADEFSGNDPSGRTTTFDAHNQATGTGCSLSVTPANANDAVWFACNDNVTAVTGSYTQGANDSDGDWTEFQIVSGGNGVAQNAGFTSSGQAITLGATIKPAGTGGATRNCTLALMGIGSC